MHLSNKIAFIGLLITGLAVWSCAPEEAKPVKAQSPLQEAFKSPQGTTPSSTESKANFTLRDEKVHTLHIICESINKDLLDSLIISLYKFNKTYYPEKKFSIAHSDLFGSKDTRDVTIASFDNKLAGMEYYHKLMAMLQSNATYASLAHSSYIIHNHNANLIRQNSSWKAYYNFFTAAYIENRDTTLRNDFDTATLYSDQDSSGYYICFSATTKDSTDIAAAKENIKSFNRLHFHNHSLSVYYMTLQEEKNKTLYSIASFQEQSVALDYLNKMSEHFSLVKPEIFLISRSNYMTLLSEGTTADYQKYYIANSKE